MDSLHRKPRPLLEPNLGNCRIRGTHLKDLLILKNCRDPNRRIMIQILVLKKKQNLKASSIPHTSLKQYPVHLKVQVLRRKSAKATISHTQQNYQSKKTRSHSMGHRTTGFSRITKHKNRSGRYYVRFLNNKPRCLVRKVRTDISLCSAKAPKSIRKKPKCTQNIRLTVRKTIFTRRAIRNIFHSYVPSS